MFSLTDVAALAAKEYHGNRSAAVEALLRNGPNIKYDPNRAYADAKVIIAWWTAALARRLPSGMAVYAVAPGSAPDTKASRNVAPILRYVFITRAEPYSSTNWRFALSIVFGLMSPTTPATALSPYFRT